MALNAKKKRQKAREQAKADAKEKWCDRPAPKAGYHGYYTGKRCPKCEEESR